MTENEERKPTEPTGTLEVEEYATRVDPEFNGIMDLNGRRFNRSPYIQVPEVTVRR